MLFGECELKIDEIIRHWKMSEKREKERRTTRSRSPAKHQKASSSPSMTDIITANKSFIPWKYPEGWVEERWIFQSMWMNSEFVTSDQRQILAVASTLIRKVNDCDWEWIIILPDILPGLILTQTGIKNKSRRFHFKNKKFHRAVICIQRWKNKFENKYIGEK